MEGRPTSRAGRLPQNAEERDRERVFGWEGWHGELVDALMDALADRHPSVSLPEDGYGARFDVAADVPMAAVAMALRVFANAAADVGLPEWPVVRVEAVTVAQQEEELAVDG